MSANEQQILAVILDYVGIYLIVAVTLAIVSQILLAFAVYNDAKARDIVNPRLFLALTMMASVPAAIAYLCVRNKQARAEQKDEALAKKAKSRLVLAIISFALIFVGMAVYFVCTFGALARMGVL